MKSETSLKSLVVSIIGAMVIVPATYATPPDATLDKLEGKKQDQVQNELGRGSEQGQLSRENSRKWWIFEVEEPEVEQPPVDEDPDPELPPTQDPDPDLPPDVIPIDRFF
jgi:hypothetical protein